MMEFEQHTYVVTLREVVSGRENSVICIAPTIKDAITGAKIERMQQVENDERWYCTMAAQIQVEQ